MYPISFLTADDAFDMLVNGREVDRDNVMTVLMGTT